MPTPRDAQMAVHSVLCIQNGLNLEGKNWMATLARDAGKSVVTASDGVKPLELETDGKITTDPHAWFSPENAAIYVRNITIGISSLDPSLEWELKARSRLYLAELRSLDSWIRQMVHVIPVSQRILVTSHDAFNYFALEYGFKNEAPIGWSTGSEIGAGMTPTRFKTVVQSIKNMGVKAVFVENSVNPKLIREIAREAGVKIGGELFSDSMGSEGTAGETYIGMMRENVLTIVGGLK
jgi:manganese/iron transport system substrate-binding protein